MLNKEHHLALEREALDHANKLAAIDQTSDPQAALEERIQLEREFLAKDSNFVGKLLKKK